MVLVADLVVADLHTGSGPVATPVQGVLFDAFGTLIELERPAPILARELQEGWDLDLSPAEVEPAIAAEISFYKIHHLEGRDAGSLADLRLRSAGVLHLGLPERARQAIDPTDLLPVLMRSLRFRPFDDAAEVLTRLRDAGFSLAVVSNWDISLAGVLDRCGLADLVDHVVSSAAIGAAKPSPAIFEKGLELLGLPAPAVVHVGDTVELDVRGAEAAGISPVLVRRDRSTGPMPGPGVPTISTLAELPLL